MSSDTADAEPNEGRPDPKLAEKDKPTTPDEVDPKTGTDSDDIPIDNPSG